MPLVRIETWPLPAEKRRALIEHVTGAVVEAVGCPQQAVEVMIFEVEKEFAIRVPEQRYGEVRTFADLVKVVGSIKGS